MSLSRSNLVVGPAKCVFTPTGGSAATFFTNDSFEVKLKPKTFEVKPQGFIQADVRDEDRVIEFDVTPDGRLNAAVIAALWPYLNYRPGQSLPTNSDQPFVAHGADTGKLTVLAAYVRKMPSLTLSAKKTAIGSAGFRGILANSMNPDDASSYLTYAASGATFADSTFDLTQIVTQPYTAAWGSVTGFGAVVGEEGFQVDFELKTKEIPVDGLGTVVEVIESVGVMVKCKPVGPTAAQILAALYHQGTGARLGASRQALSASLAITGADGTTVVTVPKATLVEAGYRFGADVLRNGEIGWVGTLNVTTGTQSAIASIAIA